MPRKLKTKTRRAKGKCDTHTLRFSDADMAKTTYVCQDCGYVEFVYEDCGTGA